MKKTFELEENIDLNTVEEIATEEGVSFINMLPHATQNVINFKSKFRYSGRFRAGLSVPSNRRIFRSGVLISYQEIRRMV